jgi:GT2 family glycosyltransferase
LSLQDRPPDVPVDAGLEKQLRNVRSHWRGAQAASAPKAESVANASADDDEPSLLERVYRALPFQVAVRMKELVFRLTGPLLHNTEAHRRWRVHNANAIPRALAARYAAAARRAAAQAASEDEIPEWSDYAPLRAQIDARLGEQRKLANEQLLAPPLLDFSGIPAATAAAAIRLPEAGAAPRLTILIPAYGHLGLTLECLASISACAEGGDEFEVLVADDASPDDTAAVLAQVPNLRVLTQPVNLGFLRNCNAAAKLARGEYLLLLNNDVQATPGWLRALLAQIEGRPEVGAVTPRLIYPSGALQEAGAILRRDGSAELIGLGGAPFAPVHSYARAVDYGSGACLLLRRADFEALCGFDERYAPAYCEDADLCLRLRKQGKRIVYAPDATVLHHLSQTSDAIGSDYKRECIARNQDQLVQRWRGELEQLDQVRSIAFYLPQFHAIPENDRWWGEGFTEWTNVRRAQPNYEGHYQPRVPADLGYYDLSGEEAMQQQAELARRYGIGAFCYYYYWFAGKRLLELPIERMLETGKPQFPFCLCWANENWTRRWDGQEKDILIGQQHSDADDAAVIADLMRYFRSPWYLRIDGKPLLLIYRPTLFPDFRRTAEHWRQLCREAGIGEIYLSLVECFELVHAGRDPAEFGCDAAVEFPPHGLAEAEPVPGALLNPDFTGTVADYRELALRAATREAPAYKRFPGVMPGWDNTARQQQRGYIFDSATPGAFQAWMETAVERARTQFSGDERLVFVNAWNEWAEGAYLEPDQRFGHGFLQAHANALAASQLLDPRVRGQG